MAGVVIGRCARGAARGPNRRSRSVALLAAAWLAAAWLAAASAGAFADDAAQSASASRSASAASAVSVASGAQAVSGAQVTPVTPGTPQSASAPQRPLDLSAPPIRHIMTPEQEQALVTDQDSAPPPEDVTVTTTEYHAPVPRGQLRAIPWAIMHPLQAWRIFAPITDQ